MAKWPTGLIPPTPWQQRTMWAALTALALFTMIDGGSHGRGRVSRAGDRDEEQKQRQERGKSSDVVDLGVTHAPDYIVPVCSIRGAALRLAGVAADAGTRDEPAR